MLSLDGRFPLAVANIFMTIACGINRANLYLHLMSLKKLSRKINKLYENVVGDITNKKHHYWIYVWLIISTSLHIPLTVNSLFNVY